MGAQKNEKYSLIKGPKLAICLALDAFLTGFNGKSLPPRFAVFFIHFCPQDTAFNLEKKPRFAVKETWAKVKIKYYSSSRYPT